MSGAYVLHTSAFLALEKEGPGGDRVAEVLERRAVMSAFNWLEVLVGWGELLPEALQLLAGTAVVVVSFEEEDAWAAAKLSATGLSLGTCACLVTARTVGLPVLTADKAMADLDVGVTIEVIP
ncbi:MAG TPA: PIN domain-containing protein [Thermoanaerobaculia bacterium]|jgi:PIN domain nuclease of toxin-antitoxin system|nr:PIN domain-containing protein [Thermoanaerobaculia bacterium]